MRVCVRVCLSACVCLRKDRPNESRLCRVNVLVAERMCPVWDLTLRPCVGLGATVRWWGFPYRMEGGFQSADVIWHSKALGLPWDLITAWCTHHAVLRQPPSIIYIKALSFMGFCCIMWLLLSMWKRCVAATVFVFFHKRRKNSNWLWDGTWVGIPVSSLPPLDWKLISLDSHHILQKQLYSVLNWPICSNVWHYWCLISIGDKWPTTLAINRETVSCATST